MVRYICKGELIKRGGLRGFPPVLEEKRKDTPGLRNGRRSKEEIPSKRNKNLS